METEFIHPNLHVALVHYPIALLVCGTLIEVFGFMWRRHSFRGAGRWMILLGALSGIPVVFSGIYALHDVQQTRPLTESELETLTDHLRLESIAIILAVLASITWVASSDWLRTRLTPALWAVLTLSVVLMLSGAYAGGRSVFENGVGVRTGSIPDGLAPSPTTAVATTSATTLATTSEAPTTAPTTEASTAFNFDRITRFAPPMQLHLILAGCSVSLALAALGLSIRRITQTVPPPQVDHIAAALGAPPSITGADASDLPADAAEMQAPRIPSARFWMLACLGMLLTAGIGYFMLATDKKTWSPTELWMNIDRTHVRQLAHIITGGSLVLLPLLLAILARAGPRQKWLLAILAILFLAAAIFQLWLGILLLYDTRVGPWNRFN